MSEEVKGETASTPVQAEQPKQNAVEPEQPKPQSGDTLLGGSDKVDQAETVTKEKADEPQKQDDNAEPLKFELKLPEGSFLSEAKLNEIKEFAIANKLTQEVAQKLLESENSTVSSYHQSLLKEHEARQTEWVNQVKADPEIGGKTFDENVKLARSIIDEFGSPQFKQDLQESGFGSHPELVKMIVKVGKTLKALRAEDGMVKGSEPPKAQKALHEYFYNQTK